MSDRPTYPLASRRVMAIALLAVLATSFPAPATHAADEAAVASDHLKGLSFRALGPGISSGRISDLAVTPGRPWEYYVSTASGGLWKTVNSGTTWQPIFDHEGSYSIGCIAMDPANPLALWVGTGENNSQRSVAYGDGVYKSVDGGTNWENVGLADSEHIGKILVDPRNSNHVYVASQGPLWREGGDRGLYETLDGGATWNRILHIDEHTGVSDLVMDPRNPDVMYASSYQRRRHVWTLINGGPGSAIHKTTDGGKTWQKLSNGLPSVDMGRIGLALSANPDIVYAIVEAASDASGFYASTDRGHNWEKRSDYVSGSPQYYQEIIADPINPNRVYSMDTFMHVTENGGASFERVPENAKHVDNHALWINPDNTNYLLAGCDGGVYETFDRGETWHFKSNLPLTQFYKITADQDVPFYNVYGGTQDNNTLGAPSRTVSASGLANRDWFITLGGDGFEPQVDPTDPNIVYSQYQNGGLGRFDKRSGELADIQPQATDETGPLKWNWSSALIISPHSPTRLYYGANYLFRSDDRGDSWRLVSGDLTRQLDRNQLEVMDQIWSVDAVSKNRSTSFYGNIVSLSESPLQEGLIYAGTDDGLIQVTSDGGANWTTVDSFPRVPDMAYISSIAASQHDAATVYATIDNHKKGDFSPYVLASTNRGKNWKSIAGDLPERGHAHSIVQDHKQPNLLFVGTEFGVFTSVDGGKHWVQLKAGIPVIACRDLEIQRREDDLVVGTFGRGMYVLDDYSPLRSISTDALNQESLLFTPRRAYMYVESMPLSLPGRAFMGDSYYLEPNPEVGAHITYYLQESIQTRREQRQDMEKQAREKGDPNPYPAWEELRREDREEEPAIVLTIRDDQGDVVRRLTGPVTKGTHRVVWNLRYSAPNPTSLTARGWHAPWDPDPVGPMVMPGTYTVTMAKRVEGQLTPLAGEVSLETIPLGLASLPADDRSQLDAFQRRTARLQRAVMGASRLAGDTQNRIDHLKQSMFDAASATEDLQAEIRALEGELADLRISLDGDRTVRQRSEPTMPSIGQRLDQIVYGHWMTSTSNPTQTHMDNYDLARAQFEPVLASLRRIVTEDIPRIENQVDAAGGPWTPGRIPTLGND